MESKSISWPTIRKNLSRHWLLLLLCAFYFLIFASRALLFLSTYRSGSFTSAIAFYNSLGEELSPRDLLGYEWNSILFSVAGVFEVFFSLLCALYGFTYLHKKKEEQFFRSLPLKKDSLYLSNLLSGFLFYAIPWLVTLILTVPFVMLWGRRDSFLLHHYIYSMVARLAVFVIAYSISVLATVLSGRRFFAILLFLLLNCMFSMLEELFYLCLEDNLFGLTFERNNFSLYLSPVAYVLQCVQESPFYIDHLPWFDMGLYVGVAFLLFLLSGYLCRKRKPENAERSLVFPSLTVFVQYLLTLMIAFLAANLLAEFDVNFDYDSSLAILIVCLLPVAFFLCRMIILRTLKVFRGKALIQCGALVLFFVSVLLFFRFDILGLTRQIPDAEKVERLTVSINRMTYTTEDPEDIADFIQVHELIVGFKDVLSKEKADPSHNFIRQWDLILEEDPTYYGLSYSLDISYEMKGRDLHRSYNLSSHGTEIDLIWSALGIYFREGDRATQQLLQVFENAEHITVSGRLWESQPGTLDGPRYTLSTSQKEALFQALLTDIEDKGMPLILQHGDLYGVEITIALKNGGFCRFYLDYHCHETARNLLDSIIDTYENPS